MQGKQDFSLHDFFLCRAPVTGRLRSWIIEGKTGKIVHEESAKLPGGVGNVMTVGLGQNDIAMEIHVRDSHQFHVFIGDAGPGQRWNESEAHADRNHV